MGEEKERSVGVKGRRIVRVGLSFPALISIMEHGKKFNDFECIKGVPKDAAFYGSYFDAERQIAWLLFIHDSFEVVLEGEVIPELKIEHE